MPRNADLWEHGSDDPGFVDHDGRPLYAHVLPAHKALLLPKAVKVRDGMALVANQRVAKAVLFGKFGLLLHGIGTDTNHLCVERLKLRNGVAETARLNGSSRCHG